MKKIKFINKSNILVKYSGYLSFSPATINYIQIDSNIYSYNTHHNGFYQYEIKDKACERDFTTQDCRVQMTVFKMNEYFYSANYKRISYVHYAIKDKQTLIYLNIREKLNKGIISYE